MNSISRIFSLCLISINILTAQIIEQLHFFPESTYVSTFTADAHAHRMEVENIIFTKNERASVGGVFPVFNLDLFGTVVQANFGGSIHFELNPMGQAHVVSNDYYVDYLLLDIPVQQFYFARFITGHTSHHLSDNWYERLKLTSAIRYSRDYVKLCVIQETDVNNQLYVGADYAYIFTVNGLRINKRWTLQTGGKVSLAEVYPSIILYAAGDCKVRQEAKFAATNTVQLGFATPMQKGKMLRISYQFRTGLDERGQFFSQHRTLHTVGFSIEP
ncbi:MAG: DUF1207 domain-containing protein [Bacteroidota bacterium]